MSLKKWVTNRPDSGEGKVGLARAEAGKRDLAGSVDADFGLALQSSFRSVFASARVGVVVEVQHADFERVHLPAQFLVHVVVLDLQTAAEVTVKFCCSAGLLLGGKCLAA